MRYYVVGFADTQGEFSPKGVTTTKPKAEKFKKELQKELYPNARQWVSIHIVNGIK